MFRDLFDVLTLLREREAPLLYKKQPLPFALALSSNLAFMHDI